MPVKSPPVGPSDCFTPEQLQPLLDSLRSLQLGDFSVRLPETEDSILGKLAQTFNDVAALNSTMAEEIERVGRQVGREGNMTERAQLRGAKGKWGVSVSSINGLIEDLARPTTEVARVITAVAEGDLSQKMALEIEGTPVKGEFLRIGTTVNTMVDQLSSFADEVTRVAREVGTEGILGGQAKVQGVSGTWRDLTDSVNGLASNLTNQVRNIALVTTAVANGDLSQKITVDARGEIQELKNTINIMVDQLNSFAAEVTRVAREVGTEGILGGQADVKGVSGTWKDLTDNVNSLAGNLTAQVRNIALVTTAVATGDLSQKITVDARGEILELKNTINIMVDQLNSFAAEVTRVAREVGTEGILGGQADVKGVSGTWKDLTDSVNFMAGNLTTQVRGIAKVVTAVANGDLKQTLVIDAKGEVAELTDTINGMIDTLSIFAQQVTTVAREVGTEGKLGGQADVPGVAGTWKDLTMNVNNMASNLTNQVRNIALVTTAVANGDLSQKITVDARGEIFELKSTINIMVDQLNSFAAEVTRVAREVGTEGILGGQAEVRGVSGTWRDLTDSVNSLASNLTSQVRNIALVTTAVANGDLSQKITVDVKGEILELKNTINVMVDQLSGFAAEVTRVAREVGTEGKLGGQAQVRDVSGTWKDLTDNVNFMASNLTGQVRNIALVTTAVANGDLSQKITVDARGEIQELKNTINVMVDQLNSFAAEVTRVAREVGTEGILGGQAEVRGVSGTWRDLTDSVNSLAGNLTAQVRNIALVTTAVATGDLSQKITVDARGEILELKGTINVMVDQLNSFAAEVTRVAREVGTEGILGGQAEVRGVSGTWRDLTDSVNSLAGNLTAQVRNIALVTTAVATGDLSQKITVDARGEIFELKNTINIMVDQLNSFAAEVTRVAREVGTEGKLGGQAEVRGVSGTWKDLTDNVNSMASNLTNQVRNIALVTTAVANGDLGRKITVDVKGEILELKNTINTMVDQLSSFAAEVTRVAREVGTEGILGGQARVPNVAGTWKDLTDNVNFMAGNLTTQVRGIAKVVTAVANGNLKQKLVIDAKGEVAALTDTINFMIDTLSIFADQVTTVAREVGTEGKLGGQARVPNVAGTWKDLTDNVNFMANSLTTQVREISEVATAVTEGDLTRLITVEAQGEVSLLKGNLNQMIANLKDTTQKNMEQDWLKTNLARFSGIMQGQKNLESVSKLIMSELTPLVGAHHGVFYLNDSPNELAELKLISSYAYRERKTLANRFKMGEGLVGQCALEKQRILLTSVPNDYIVISSGLGEALPHNIIVLPVIFEESVLAVIELASFQPFSAIHLTFLDQLMESVGVVLNMIGANMRTEELLQRSQSLTQELQSQSQELQSQQDQLRSSNYELEHQAKELEEKATLLAVQNNRVEQKNREVEQARVALEEKAQQLTLSSKYKSEFLANMSHELRTPLNSMLILARLLADNRDGNLSGKQIEFANTIYASGGDLLTLINEILDLSKVESGKMELDIAEHSITELSEFTERTFRQLAIEKSLDFSINVALGTPNTISTDIQRVQQVLKNLLANAFKFTELGSVTLDIAKADKTDTTIASWFPEDEEILSFAVVDTGIGIPRDKQELIFEAFQQADGTTNRRYGGTGLGLSISREITRLLGGRIRVTSEPGVGSTFTLYVPRDRGDDTSVSPTLSNDRNSFETNLYTPNPDSVPLIAPENVELPRPTITEDLSDDRLTIANGDRSLLVIEDDPTFAGILLRMARQQGFKTLIAQDGQSGLDLARRYVPSAVTLDLKLIGVDGWTVLDQLKRDITTRHIPVQVISVMDRERGAALGAISYLEKPVSSDAIEGALTHIKHYIDREVKQLLVIEDDTAQGVGITELVQSDDVAVSVAKTGAEALEFMDHNEIDCVVLDLTLPDMEGFEVLSRIKKQPRYLDLPIIIYTGRDLSRSEEEQLKKHAASVIIKTKGSSEQLLNETAMFLHRVVSRMPEAKQKIVSKVSGAKPTPIEAGQSTGTSTRRSRSKNGRANVEEQTPGVHNRTETKQLTNGNLAADNNARVSDPDSMSLDGKSVLIVDDDMRNIFALSSMLESFGMTVHFAENGADGISMLEKTPGIDIVLMDVMMPVMDGYETTRAIRGMRDMENLPIISLTAKAMVGDREKCLAAGASDYIPKPVDIDKLSSMIRRWIAASQE